MRNRLMIPVRLRAAHAALLGRTVVYRARFENGMLALDDSRRGGVMAENRIVFETKSAEAGS